MTVGVTRDAPYEVCLRSDGVMKLDNGTEVHGFQLLLPPDGADRMASMIDAALADTKGCTIKELSEIDMESGDVAVCRVLGGDVDRVAIRSGCNLMGLVVSIIDAADICREIKACADIARDRATTNLTTNVQ